ncbi:hypothetical protein [Streptomyces sp. NPDC055692]
MRLRCYLDVRQTPGS